MNSLIRLLSKSKYHSLVVLFYIFIYLYFFFFIPFPLSYFTFNNGDIFLSFSIFVFAVVTLFIVNKFLYSDNLKINKKSLSQILFIIFYAVILFALPEEILFRGIIQNKIGLITSNEFIIVISSAFIFGIAHLLNGAKSLCPTNWNWRLAIITFTAGIYLSFSYFITGSLIMPIILHALFIIINKLFIKE